ncbi:hypothetical protein EIB75_05560 [Epilithonimonas vandammei]|uniref:Uncharacterized protein n=1 Tax=Epilithonimonas vandammei TaxID=2487072 RepID=A0A3G8ZBD5_9FLAO|nr:hypothetical protein [Epilithonimonas vandammei]AZI54749.1 hypothetical protein EIB75_05560 [Epilithonimonas vandammei]
MENQKPNDESKSSGMELLENVISSNERNIESTAGLKGDVEDLVTIIHEAQFNIKNTNEIFEEMKEFSKVEQLKREEFVKMIPTKFETFFSEETLGHLDDFKKQLKITVKFIKAGIVIFILAILVLIISVNLATQWYKESIKAKSELRQDILNEIADEGKKIYDENEIKMLQDNTTVMQLWIKNNPKKAVDFLRFKDGFEARKSE